MNLEPPDSHHLLAAQGWLELGNPDEARSELDQIHTDLQSHPDVLMIRWQVGATERKWDECVDIGSTLVKLAPDRPDSWVHRSFALHELKRTYEALKFLLPAAVRFPKLWLIRYNLACYNCQLGKLDEARQCLKMAFKLGAIDDLREMARKDPDLQPLAPDIESL